MLQCGKRKNGIGKVRGENETLSAEKVRIKTFQKKRYSRHNVRPEKIKQGRSMFSWKNSIFLRRQWIYLRSIKRGNKIGEDLKNMSLYSILTSKSSGDSLNIYLKIKRTFKPGCFEVSQSCRDVFRQMFFHECYSDPGSTLKGRRKNQT